MRPPELDRLFPGRRPEAAERPFLVDDPERAWVVAAGRLDVFSVPAGTGPTGGPRRHLHSAEPGELVLGFPELEDVEHPVSAVAVPVGGTEVIPLPSSVLADLIRDPGTREAAEALLGSVVTAVGHAVSRDAAPRIRVTLEPGEETVLHEHRRASVEGRGWISVSEGRLRVGDSSPVTLGPGTAPLPMAEGLWLTPMEESRVTFQGTDAVADAPDLLDGIRLLGRCFAHWAAADAQADEEAERVRQEAKAELDRSSRMAGLRELGEVLGEMPGPDALLLGSGDELLAAMRIAGRSQGLQFVQAPEWELASRRRDPLQAICRASRIRSRQIGLRGEWWSKDGGDLVVFLKGEERRPAALVWEGDHYDLVLPTDGARQPVDEALAATIEPLGFTFYKPFPDRALDGKDLLALAYDSVRGEVGTLLGLSLATALIALILPWATDRMLSDIVPVTNYGAAFVLTSALIAVQLGSAVFEAAKAFVLVRMEGLTNARLQAGMVDRLLSLPTRFYRRFTVGDLASRASGINTVRDLLAGAAGQQLLGGVFSTVFLLQLWWYSWRLTLVALGMMAVGAAVAAILVVRSVKWQRIQQDMAGKLSGFTVQLIGAIPKLRVAAAEDRAFSQWSHRFRKQKDAARTGGLNDILLQVFTSVLPLLASMALFAYAGWMTNEGKEYALAPGEFVAFNAAFGTFFIAFVNLTNTLVTVLVAVPMLERAAPILTAQPEVSDDRSDPGELTGRIEVSHLTFRYREDGPVILEDVSFRAEPGEFVAFVGPSGSGKSTCLRMLLGFEEPEAGAVYYDRQDLATLDPTAVRSQMGVVLQTSRLSQGDIYQNIVGSAPLSLDEAWEAAEAAGLAEDIEEMPMQMHTVVSEGGSTLSGGQRQRLMIARALVRKPRIIFFDEATSALDNRTQEQVSESLEQTNATRIVIAHRLSTIRHADRIYVMDRGKVVQSGSFDELAEQPGMFSELVARQMQ